MAPPLPLAGPPPLALLGWTWLEQPDTAASSFCDDGPGSWEHRDELEGRPPSAREATSTGIGREASDGRLKKILR
jgi:hypothetical protein